MTEPLTPRETEVWEAIAAGLTNQQVGDRLHIARKTAETYAHAIYQKLGVRNRTEAMMLWVQRQIEG